MSRISVLTLFLFAALIPRLGFTQGERVERLPPPKGLVENMFFMPYLTVSYNLHSGKAFEKSANGIGFGGGIAFDFTKDGQKSGFYLDIAFQDMRAAAEEGVCMNDEFDEILTSERAEHYYQYVLLEPFIKLQGERANGYFLLGGSFGYAVESSLRKVGDVRTEFSNWSAQEFHNPFRFDLRAGLGLIVANVGANKLVFEARVGYPITPALSDLRTFCDEEGLAGSWRVISVQANLGLRM